MVLGVTCRLHSSVCFCVCDVGSAEFSRRLIRRLLCLWMFARGGKHLNQNFGVTDCQDSAACELKIPCICVSESW